MWEETILRADILLREAWSLSTVKLCTYQNLRGETARGDSMSLRGETARGDSMSLRGDVWACRVFCCVKK